MFSTVSLVRDISGFQDATKVVNALIESKISTADGMIRGALAYRYQLPLIYRKQGVLTFSGTGTGIDDMDIVINGTTYTIGITVGLTATQAADLFRIEAAASTDFYIDTLGNGASVIITAKTDSDDLTTSLAEVTVTSALTTEAIALSSIVQDCYPSMISNLSAEIATAFLFITQYGRQAEDTPKDGYAKLDTLQLLLGQLAGTEKEKVPLRVFDDYTELELALIGTEGPSFLPNATTDADSANPTSAKVSINTKF